MKKLLLAVISDVHVGEGARAKDLCPANAPGRDTKPDDKYIEKFVEFLKSKKIKADYLILPGTLLTMQSLMRPNLHRSLSRRSQRPLKWG